MCECAHLSEPITAPGAHYTPSQTSPSCCLSAQQTPTHFPSCSWKAIFSDLPGWGWLHLISQLLHNSYIAPKWLLTNWGTFPKVSSTELTPHAVRCSMRKGLCEQIHLGHGTYDVPFLNSMHRTILRDTLLFCHTGTPESLLRSCMWPTSAFWGQNGKNWWEFLLTCRRLSSAGGQHSVGHSSLHRELREPC